MKKINLAFFINFNHKKWLGGFNIILNLANYLAENQKKLNHNFKIILVTKDQSIKRDFNISNKIKIILDKNIIDTGILKRIFEKFFLLIFGKTFFLEKFIVKNNIKFISHSNFATGINSHCKSIVWIPDFQYLHLPNLFSLKYKIFKKINLYLYSKNAHKILLSSLNAKNDLKKVSNILNNKIIISKFVFTVKNPSKLPKINKLIKKFKIQKKYIFLPNQYWVHKNHITVLKALNSLDRKILDKYKIQIVSTGSNKDYRNQNHFKRLAEFIKKNKITKYYKYIGLIKYDEVLSLMYNSKCVLNPSLFEGWSSTVEQAKSYEKNLILSKIGVHLEQNPKFSNYFDPNNSEKLGKLIFSVYKNKNSIKQNFNFKTTEKKIKTKIFHYAKNFCEDIY